MRKRMVSEGNGVDEEEDGIRRKWCIDEEEDGIRRKWCR